MSGRKIAAELKRLEGNKEFRSNCYRSFVFHRGHKTFYCIPYWSSVNHPQDMAALMSSSNGYEQGTTDTAVIPGSAGVPTNLLADYYLWGNETQMTITNRSILPVYVKIWFCQARDDLPVENGSTYAKYDSRWIPNATVSTAGQKSYIIDMFFEGLKDKVLDSNETIGSNRFFTTDQGNTGGGTDGEVVDIGEGTGVAATAGTPKPWLLTSSVGDNPEYGIAVPTLYNLHDSSTFCQNFKVYHCEKVKIDPECFHVTGIADKRLKVIRFDDDKLRGWVPTESLHNRWTKFMVIEVVGSLTAADPFDSVTGASAFAADDPATAETININNALERVHEHAGFLTVKYDRKFSAGYFQNASIYGDHIVGYSIDDNRTFYAYHDPAIYTNAQTTHQ